MALSDALKAVVDAVDALEAEVSAPVETDAVRKAVEDVLTSEGWVVPGVPAPAEGADVPTDVPA